MDKINIQQITLEEFKQKFTENPRWLKYTIFDACKNGRLDIVQFLVDEQGFDVNEGGVNFMTLLMYAAQNGHFNIVQQG